MPGPLPNPARRRRNAPTIAGTTLPAEGFKGRIPRVPKSYELADAGKAWWKWAWRTPQAAAWDAGSLYVLVRRAALEDDLATIGAVESLDLSEALDALEAIDGRAFRQLLGRLAGLATGRVAIMKEARELDNRLGLTPKGRSDLRWTIAEAPEPTQESSPAGNGRRLRAVDPAPG